MASPLSLDFVPGATLSGAFGRVFNTVTKKVSQLGAAVKATDDQLRDVHAYQDTQAALGQTHAKVGELQAAMANAGGSNKMARQSGMVDKEAARLSSTLAAQKTQLAIGSDALRKTGADNGKLGDATRALNTKFNEQQVALDSNTQRLNRRRSAVKEMRAQIGKLSGMVSFGKKAIGSAISFEAAMADVKQVLDFDSPEQFAEMEQAINDLALSLPVTREGLAGIVAAGAQAGLPRKELVGLAEDAAKMGIAFNTTAEDAGQQMVQWRKAFDLSQDGARALGDQINLLGKTSGVSALDIAEVLGAVGPLGHVGSLASGQIAALGATMRSAGVDTDTAAAGAKNFMLAMTAGASATPKQAAALQALGLDAATLAERMQNDAGGAINDLVTRLEAMPEASQVATLGQLLGSESAGAVGPLLSELDALKDNLRKVGDASKYSGSMELEFLARTQSTDKALEIGKNAWGELIGVIGKAFLPIIKVGVAQLVRVTKVVTRFAAAFPNLTRGLVLATTAFLSFKAVMATLRVASLFLPDLGKMNTRIKLLAPGLGLARKGIAALGSAMSGASRALLPGLRLAQQGIGALTLAMRGAGVAALANPIGLVIAGIAVAVIGVTLVIRKYWEPIKAFFGGVFQGIGEALGPTFAAFGDALAPLKLIWDAIAGAVQALFGWFGKLLQPMDATQQQLDSAASAGRLFGEILGGVLNALTLPIRIVWAAFKGLGTLIGNTAGWIATNFSGLGDIIAGAFNDPISFVVGLWDWLKGKVGAVVDWISEKFAWFSKGKDGLKFVADKVGDVGGKIGNAFQEDWNTLRSNTGRAVGTAVLGAALAAPAGAAGVPQVNMPTLPTAAATTRAMPPMNQSTHTTTITVQGTPGMDERQLAQEVRRQMDDRDRAQSARTRSTLGDLE